MTPLKWWMRAAGAFYVALGVINLPFVLTRRLEGQYLTGTFMDYLLPGATDVPDIEIIHIETPRPDQFLGVGESGAVVGPPAVTNAIADALGTKTTDRPITPTRVLQLLGVIP